MKNIFKKLVAFWGVLIAPIKAYLAKLKAEKEKQRLEEERLKSIEDLKVNFAKTYNVNISKSVKAMETQKAKQTDKDFLTNELVKARKYMNDNGIQPGGGQVTNIDDMLDHNANGGYTDKTISEVIRQDSELARKDMNGKLDKERQQKAKLRWIQRD
jgi:hypothetical protein